MVLVKIDSVKKRLIATRLIEYDYENNMVNSKSYSSFTRKGKTNERRS